VSALLSAPWRAVHEVAEAVGAAALYGLLYMAWVLYRTWRQKAYEPVTEDWIWYSILPTGAYIALAIGAVWFATAPEDALFMIAGVVLLLILIGIHNSWDIVTYIATGKLDGQTPASSKDQAANPG
jgi:hypothetical protein